MIRRLVGMVVEGAADHVVIDVGGVGYLVQASSRTLRLAGALGTTATLLIETFIRDDRIVLYGFHDPEEQDRFRLLITVPGVGPQVALNVLSVLSPLQLDTAIRGQDKTALAQAGGVGPKLAVRLLSELKDKVPQVSSPPDSRFAGGSDHGVGDMGEAVGAAVSALVNLGYRRPEAYEAVTRAAREGADDTADLLRRALRSLAR